MFSFSNLLYIYSVFWNKSMLNQIPNLQFSLIFISTIWCIAVRDWYFSVAVSSNNFSRAIEKRKKKNQISSFLLKCSVWGLARKSLTITMDLWTLKIDRHYLSGYTFGQVHALHLLNVVDVQIVICQMNLKNLCLSFDKDYNHFSAEYIIPPTVIRFSTNAVLNANAIQTNLIHLSLHARFFVYSIEIVERTSATLWPYY
jgi:hypothetical protein